MEEGRSEREGKLSRVGIGGLRKRGNQVEVEEVDVKRGTTEE